LPTVRSLLCCWVALSGPAVAAPPESPAGEILNATGVRGGLVVHVGCGDGSLTASLGAANRYLVQGLATDADDVARARERVRALGLYGRISIDRYDGRRLPYVDGLVNLVVAEDPADVPLAELMRVLCPNGVAYVKRDGAWIRNVKPRPQDIDAWTHYLHDASNNAVANDSVVGPPAHLQWVGSPRWTRHHDHMSSFNAMVTDRGRVFYVIDEGLRAEVQLPAEWKLVARDAFSGVVLWKRAIEPWHIHLWPLKSGPAQLPRRLVVGGDSVYFTLGLGAPVSAIDPATGETRRTFGGTEGAEELLYSDGVLFVLVDETPTSRPWSTRSEYDRHGDVASEPQAWAWKGETQSIVALRPETGEILWKARSAVAPLSLGADAGRVVFHDGESVVALDRRDGSPAWKSKPVSRAAKIRSWFGITLVVKDGVVVVAGGEKILRHKGGKDTMTALDAATGKTLWTAAHAPSGYDSPEDVFVIDGLVWTAPTTNRRDTGRFTGRDLHTGEVKRSFPADDGTHMPHHRCHRAKATNRFVVASRTGIEYVDLNAEHWNRNDWVRGACLYGVVPANGLTYAPPHSCACYVVAKLSGLNALAPARRTPTTTSGTEAARSTRLVRGPAHGAVATQRATGASDWPTYRHDAARSGRTTTTVPTELRHTWRAEIGGRLTSPVIANGRVYVASVDAHAVRALDEATGRGLWSHTAGARVDSPPTIWSDRVIFGSADGHVTCLRASDGELVWRFRAAPEDLRLTAWEQVESVWPVHGSVLIIPAAEEGRAVVHCVAGRSMFLDGGLRYLRLDAASGRKLSETVLDAKHPQSGKPLDAGITWPNLPVALPDVLSFDGTSVYMRSQPFDTAGKRVGVRAPSDFADQKGDGAHLFSPTGFLDDSWWHRTYWLYGKSPMSGAGGWYLAAYRAPAGRIMVFDEARVYAFGRRPQYFPRTTALEYHVFAASKSPEIVPVHSRRPGGSKSTAKGAASKPRRKTPTRPRYAWSRTAPVLGRAIALADETLFVAGPPDVVDQEETITRISAAATKARLAAQRDAYAGEMGGVLVALSARDGEKRAAYKIDSVPIFDGMAAANGRLFLSTTDGGVMCLGSEGRDLVVADGLAVKKTPTPAAAAPAQVNTTRHPDFHHLENIRVSPADLGWRLQTTGKVGLALRKLERPLTGRTTLTLRFRMIPNVAKDPSRPPPGNAFLAFGDAPKDARLIKCGLRSAGQMCQMVEGPLLSGRSLSRPAKVPVNETIELVATIDLERQTVTMTVLGQSVERRLERRIERITHVGYVVQSVTSEFGPIASTPSR